MCVGVICTCVHMQVCVHAGHEVACVCHTEVIIIVLKARVIDKIMPFHRRPYQDVRIEAA